MHGSSNSFHAILLSYHYTVDVEVVQVSHVRTKLRTPDQLETSLSSIANLIDHVRRRRWIVFDPNAGFRNHWNRRSQYTRYRFRCCMEAIVRRVTVLVYRCCSLQHVKHITRQKLQHHYRSGPIRATVDWVLNISLQCQFGVGECTIVSF